MSAEQSPNSSLPEFSIPEQELGYLDYTGRLEMLLQILKDNNVYDETALYCGIEGELLKQNGTFGERPTTFAVTESQFRTAAANSDRFDARNENPLSYATSNSDLPAIAVFAKKFFEPCYDDDHSDLKWKLKDGAHMDDAATAVIYLTS